MSWQEIVKEFNESSVDPFQSSEEVQAKLEEAYNAMQNAALEALHLDSLIGNQEQFVERLMNDFRQKLDGAFKEGKGE